MIKDPMSDETPYEMLHLNPAASHAEVKKRIVEFQKEHRGRIRDAQHARNVLLDNKKRMILDILLYDAGEIDTARLKPADINAAIDGQVRVPVLRDDEFYSDLDRDDLDKEVAPIGAYQPSFGDECRFGDEDLERFDESLIVFDV